ncbi:uncharacterized protein LOC106648157 [Trichogramma pretiosum]|uniref:uncharacterized protein LOC106648157 n=1 Tax=Trichogramma pretiosum TaxID=7493 RepID=UPI000C71BEF4|nr:uncharacterized protein LOC106648157 [Trichogramma pretiosum]
MKMSNIFNRGFRVKERPKDVSFIEYDDHRVIDTMPNENVQFSRLLRENSIYKLPKCNINHENKLGDKIEIAFDEYKK